MVNILVSGATGNIGEALIIYLLAKPDSFQVTAGVRDIAKAKAQFSAYLQLRYVHFDFAEPASFSEALSGIDTVFLLRPPQLADVQQYFAPLLEQARQQGIRRIMFLSVQGAEKSSIIPHRKIERLIQAHRFEYIFVRPSYFMQNLTTTLLPDIRQDRKIVLPAGKAAFNWVDVDNVAEASAQLLQSFAHYKNQAITLTGNEQLTFGEVADLFQEVLDLQVEYISTNPVRYYCYQRKAGMPRGKAMVMLVLHFLPRLQATPPLSGWYEQLTGKQATPISAFLLREKETFC